MRKKALGLFGVLMAFVLAFLMTDSGKAFARVVGTWEYPTLTLTSGQTLSVAGAETHTGAETHSGTVTFSGGRLGPIPAAQTIAAAGQIAADACGGLKQITAAGVVTSSTTTPFPLAAAGNAGCVMDVVNIGTNAITVKRVINAYNWASSADVVLGSSSTFRVGSNGTAWFQLGATGSN